MTALRLLETVHGHLGVLAAAALLHPAILLRKGGPLSPRGRLSVALTTAAVVLAFVTGLTIYPAYRSSVRAGLFRADAAAGFLFETKEHLAYGVIAATVGAAVCALAAPPHARELRRAAAALFAIGAALCLLVSGLGSWIASVHGFGMR